MPLLGTSVTRIFIDFLQDSQTPSLDGVDSYPESVELNPELTHHLRDVLRLEEGRQLVVVNRQTGLEYFAIVAAATKESALKVQLVKKLDREIQQAVVSTLICGLPKGSHADQICEQVSQLGVERIVFWSADRSVAQPKQAGSKLDRWQKIAESAARQSKQNSIPKVYYLASSQELYAWIKSNIDKDNDAIAVCSLQPDAKLITGMTAPIGRINLVIGPEGDFSPKELSALDELGARQVSLGPLVMRVETAAVAAVSMGLAVWGWRLKKSQ